MILHTKYETIPNGGEKKTDAADPNSQGRQLKHKLHDEREIKARHNKYRQKANVTQNKNGIPRRATGRLAVRRYSGDIFNTSNIILESLKFIRA